MYIPAGLIEIHPHMKYQLATGSSAINRSWDSTLDKNLNLVYGRTDHGGIKNITGPSNATCMHTLTHINT